MFGLSLSLETSQSPHIGLKGSLFIRFGHLLILFLPKPLEFSLVIRERSLSTSATAYPVNDKNIYKHINATALQIRPLLVRALTQ